MGTNSKNVAPQLILHFWGQRAKIRDCPLEMGTFGHLTNDLPMIVHDHIVKDSSFFFRGDQKVN